MCVITDNCTLACARSVLLKVRNSISICDHTKVTSVLASVAISRHPPGGTAMRMSSL
jgi:hypothetical protein